MNQLQAGKINLKSSTVLLSIVLLYCILTKIWGLTRPFVGNFASYQLMMADVAKFYVLENFKNIFLPMTFISETGAPGILALNFPVPALLAAVLFKGFGATVEFWGHFQTILFSMGATLFLYGFVKERLGKNVAIWSAFIFNLSPLTTIYGQSFMYEMPAVCLTLGAFFVLQKWHERPWCGLVLGLLTALILVMRIHLLVILLPLTWIFYEKDKFKFLTSRNFWIFLLIGLSIPAGWYGYTYWLDRYSGTVLMTLFAQVELYSNLGLQENPFRQFLSSDFYGNLFYFSWRYLLTPIGLVILPFAIGESIAKKGNRLFLVWLLALLVSMMILPKKYSEQNFYLLSWLVPISILFGIYLEKIFQLNKSLRPFWILLGIVSIFINAIFSHNPAFAISFLDKKLLMEAQAIQKMSVPQDRIIIGTRLGRVELLSLSERVGWRFPLGPEGTRKQVWYKLVSYDYHLADPVANLEDYKENGARYFFVIDVGDFEKNQELKKYLENSPRVEDPETGLIRFDLRGKES